MSSGQTTMTSASNADQQAATNFTSSTSRAQEQQQCIHWPKMANIRRYSEKSNQFSSLAGVRGSTSAGVTASSDWSCSTITTNEFRQQTMVPQTVDLIGSRTGVVGGVGVNSRRRSSLGAGLGQGPSRDVIVEEEIDELETEMSEVATGSSGGEQMTYNGTFRVNLLLRVFLGSNKLVE
jgi:hypothetical protein